MTDEQGNVTDTYNYDAFGNLTSQTGNTDNNYLYAGEQLDRNTDLYYLRARYMNPKTGVFISMDPYSGNLQDPISLHKYLYANANPITYTDPTGLFSLGDLSASSAISGILDGMVQSRAYFILNKVRTALLAGSVVIPTGYYVLIVHQQNIADGFLDGTLTSPSLFDYLIYYMMVAASPGETQIIQAKKSGESTTGNSTGASEQQESLEAVQKPNPPENKDNREYKKSKSGSGKEKSTDAPSWAKNLGERPYKGESGKDFAKRLCDERYGKGNYDTGPGSDYNKIKKWGDRSFE
ncbi:hypothetical protein AGMMS49975_21930 [Clostridia bacterium]|nr:hypothetical protein AGMMS49975_21930 [Clostridia bacterium]